MGGSTICKVSINFIGERETLASYPGLLNFLACVEQN